MQLLNRYFFPYAAFLILTAIYCVEPDRRTTALSVGVLLVSAAVNHWFVRYSYRIVRWTRFLRAAQVWLNYVWSVPLVYLLGGWWAPMWLLLAMAPATAAMFQSRRQTLLTAMLSALTLLALYWYRGVEGPVAWGQALVHASFIIVFSMLIHSLNQLALRLRDSRI